MLTLQQWCQNSDARSSKKLMTSSAPYRQGFPDSSREGTRGKPQEPSTATSQGDLMGLVLPHPLCYLKEQVMTERGGLKTSSKLPFYSGIKSLEPYLSQVCLADLAQSMEQRGGRGGAGAGGGGAPSLPQSDPDKQWNYTTLVVALEQGFSWWPLEEVMIGELLSWWRRDSKTLGTFADPPHLHKEGLSALPQYHAGGAGFPCLCQSTSMNMYCTNMYSCGHQPSSPKPCQRR